MLASVVIFRLVLDFVHGCKGFCFHVKQNIDIRVKDVDQIADICCGATVRGEFQMYVQILHSI